MTLVDRTQQILLQLINAHGPLTSAEIAANLNVSGRTVIGEMGRVADELLRHGARLVLRRNWGYAISVTDEALFSELRSNLDILAMQIEVASYDETARFIYIARRLIASPEGVRLDAISDELSVSRSALREPLRLAYRFLKSYHLEIVSVPKLGVTVRGEEYRLRFAMTELFLAHFHKARPKDLDAGYASIIACGWQERQDIRHLYLEIQRESGWSPRDSRTQRLSMLLIISRNRARAGHNVKLNATWEEELRQTPQFDCARRVLDRLAKRFDDFNLDDGECALLALYMIESLTIDLNADGNRCSPRLQKDAEQAARKVARESARSLGINLFSSTQDQELLAQALLPICVAIRYGLDGHECFDHENERTIQTSPLCMAAASRIALVIEECLTCHVSRSTVYVLAAIVARRLFMVSYEVRPLRLLVSDGTGTEFARCKGEMLMQMFPDLIESVAPFELYEMRGLDENSYDAAIIDSQKVSYSYSYPAAHAKFVEWRSGFAAIHDDLLVRAYRVEGTLFDPNRINVRRMRGPASLDVFLRRIGVAVSRREALLEQSFEPYASASEVSVLVDFVDDVANERVEVAHFAGASSGGVRDIVYLAVSGSLGERHLKSAERLAYYLRMGVPKSFDDDPAGSCLQILRRSLGISGKGC